MDLAKLDDELKRNRLAGFWKSRVPLHQPEAPYLWKWDVVRDALMKAKDAVGIDMAERRAIRLVNPHAPTHSTSRTLQLTFSIVNPGEVARAHRHNMAAIRFVVEGQGAYTVVEGERFPMEEGDLILTPNWTWHEHHNPSASPIIWLDGLDGPLIHSLNALFFEPYAGEQQPLTRAEGDSGYRYGFARAPAASEKERRGLPFRYRWRDTEAALKKLSEAERDPCDGALLRYVNPVTGGPTLATMSCEVQSLRPREKTAAHRHTSTALYHVFKGSGRTAVGEGWLEWKKGDSFVIPLWQWHRHENNSDQEAVLFSLTDRPVMEALCLYREQTEAGAGAR
ncbi:MAG TPA: cupin domain-containing protein [Candidatus Acidoferrales bacterium]|nr:cupin domain-containing protein [Candidatus Acidoferrales bacterium]